MYIGNPFKKDDMLGNETLAKLALLPMEPASLVVKYQTTVAEALNTVVDDNETLADELSARAVELFWDQFVSVTYKDGGSVETCVYLDGKHVVCLVVYYAFVGSRLDWEAYAFARGSDLVGLGQIAGFEVGRIRDEGFGA